MGVGNARLIDKARGPRARVVDSNLMRSSGYLDEAAFSDGLVGGERTVSDPDPGEYLVLNNIPTKDFVLIAELIVDSSRSFPIIYWGGQISRDSAEFNWHAIHWDCLKVIE